MNRRTPESTRDRRAILPTATGTDPRPAKPAATWSARAGCWSLQDRWTGRGHRGGRGRRRPRSSSSPPRSQFADGAVAGSPGSQQVHPWRRAARPAGRHQRARPRLPRTRVRACSDQTSVVTPIASRSFEMPRFRCVLTVERRTDRRSATSRWLRPRPSTRKTTFRCDADSVAMARGRCGSPV